jgi:hypothetical protein
MICSMDAGRANARNGVVFLNLSTNFRDMKKQATKIKLSMVLLLVLVVLVILSYFRAYFQLWLVVSFLGWYLAAFVALLMVLWFTKPIIYNVFVSLSIVVASLLCGVIIFQQPVGYFLEQWSARRIDRELKQEAQGIGVFSGRQETQLAQAIVQNDVAKVRTLLANGLDIQGKGKNEESFLEFALSQRARQEDYILDPALVKELLDHGIDPNANSNPYGVGNTIEYWQNFNPDNPIILELLLKAGANIPTAWYRSSVPDLRVYIQHGVKINETTVTGYNLNDYLTPSRESKSNYVTGHWTPVMHLVEAEQWEQAIYLVDLGADLVYRDEHAVDLQKIMVKQERSYYDQPDFQKLAAQITRKKQKLKG